MKEQTKFWLPNGSCNALRCAARLCLATPPESRPPRSCSAPRPALAPWSPLQLLSRSLYDQVLKFSICSRVAFGTSQSKNAHFVSSTGPDLVGGVACASELFRAAEQRAYICIMQGWMHSLCRELECCEVLRSRSCAFVSKLQRPARVCKALGH